MNLLDKSCFNTLTQTLIERGFEEEINWQRNVQPCQSEDYFATEAIWVILNSGMKNQIARQIWNKIQQAWKEDRDISEVFGHKGKVAAIKHIRKNAKDLFHQYLQASDKIAYLRTLPWIGEITCWHLAKNLGFDVVKPDRHLQRVAKHHNTTPDDLCEKISKMTGEKKCTVDYIIWRACNLNLIVVGSVESESLEDKKEKSIL